MSAHSMDTKSVLTEFNTDLKNGLSNEEVLLRKEKFGENKLKEKKKKTCAEQVFLPFQGLFKYFLDHPKLKALRHGIQKEKKGVTVDGVDKA